MEKNHNNMKKYNMIIFVIWIGLGLFLMAFSYWKTGLGGFHSPGPGLTPFLIGALLLLLSLFSLITNLLGKGIREELLEEQRQVSFRKFNAVVASLIFYGLFLEILGFMVCTFLLLFFLFWGMGSRLRSAIVTSVLSILVTYFVFTYLGIRFPPGILTLIGIY